MLAVARPSIAPGRELTLDSKNGRLYRQSVSNTKPQSLWESQKIWPSVAQPDVFISLGTVTSNYPGSKAPKFRHIYRDGFIPRLFRSFSSLLDGQRTWQDLINSLNEGSREDYFRLNIVFAGQEPALDDVSSMDSMREKSYSHPMYYNHNDTVVALLAATFFFELSEIPSFGSGRLYCQGTIRCRLTGKTILSVLERVCKSPLHFYIDNERLG